MSKRNCKKEHVRIRYIGIASTGRGKYLGSEQRDKFSRFDLKTLANWNRSRKETFSQLGVGLSPISGSLELIDAIEGRSSEKVTETPEVGHEVKPDSPVLLRLVQRQVKVVKDNLVLILVEIPATNVVVPERARVIGANSPACI